MIHPVKHEKSHFIEGFHDHDASAVDRFMHDDRIQDNPDGFRGKVGSIDFQN